VAWHRSGGTARKARAHESLYTCQEEWAKTQKRWGPRKDGIEPTKWA